MYPSFHSLHVLIFVLIYEENFTSTKTIICPTNTQIKTVITIVISPMMHNLKLCNFILQYHLSPVLKEACLNIA